jgi:putative endopeptidase
MDEAGIEKLGTKSLAPQMERIAVLKSKAELAGLVGQLHTEGVGAMFQFGAGQDFKEPTQVIAQADQGGLGLPERDYYLKDDAKSAELRRKYVAHVQRMFELLGDEAAAAEANARSVMELETALAKASLEVVKRRDPQSVYHKMTVAELAALSPLFAWDSYLKAVDAPEIRSLNVAVPDFFKGLQQQLDSASLATWKTYLRWRVVHAAAPFLPNAFVNEDFEFYGRALEGAKELQPRWKRCVGFADDRLGEAVGQRYVEATFPPESKQRMSKMVAALEQALRTDIEDLPWMGEATAKRAVQKLDAIANKIGYPDKWRDYSSLEIVAGDAQGNWRRAAAFELRRQLDKIGKPVDKGEWQMTPPTVNAYYEPLMNDINFPAGILQPPFFDPAMDDAVNFGGIGAVIGHELTHGFDDQGRQFAADGSLSDWWTETDAKEFEKRAGCIVDQYGSYTVVDDLKLNGKLTLGENTADNGGVRIALMALEQLLAEAPAGPRDGFTPEQRFFLGWGQIWCQNRTPEIDRLRTLTDPHSPGRFRVNGVVSNMPEFQKAFSCPAGSPMVPESACRVW